MKKYRIFFIFLLFMVLLSCNQTIATTTYEKVTIFFQEQDYNQGVVGTFEGNIGDEIQLEKIQLDFLEFKGWYRESSLTTLVENIVLEDDITLYGKYEPTLSIAIVTYEEENQYHNMIEAIDDYANENSRIYQIYKTPWPDPYQPENTLEAIDSAVEDGAKIVILTSGYYHSEAAFVAQSKYPDIKFVLIGDQPKEDAFWSQPYIAANTLSTTSQQVFPGFMAGYSAVYEGYRSLGFLNTTGYTNIQAGIGFISGAYYAANQLKVDIDINDIAYKNFDHPSMLVISKYADVAFESGAELIYAQQIDEGKTLEMLASEQNRDIILAMGSLNGQSDSVLSIIERDLASTVTSILDDFFDDNFQGGRSVFENFSLDVEDYIQFNETEFDRIMDLVINGSLIIPNDYESLLIFLDSLENIDQVTYERSLIEYVHSIYDLIE